MSSPPDAVMADLKDVSHAKGDPRCDKHLLHIWLNEPPISHGVLTVDGMTQIATHKYKGGSYTHLDDFLSPNFWGPLTELLPMWLAPNVVTTLGGLGCLITFVLSAIYNESPPQWLFASNGLCMFWYYTLDCMDGKQARRTGSSSPLGQLFDHGMDCLCNLSHLQLVQAIVQVPPHLLIVLQCSLQFTFWQAQWEEYYTGILPHATGKFCGVTEVNYGLAAWSLATGIFGRQFWDTPVILEIPYSNYLVGEEQLQIRHVAAIGWFVMISNLVVLSWIRVYQKVQNLGVFASAMSKFISPLALAVFAMWGLTDQLDQTAHAGSLSLGLCYCLITIKLIVYSMARMAYASIQPDILPLIGIVVAAHVLEINHPLLFQLLDVLYLARLLYWVHQAITQICERLKIPLFRIQKKE